MRLWTQRKGQECGHTIFEDLPPTSQIQDPMDMYLINVLDTEKHNAKLYNKNMHTTNTFSTLQIPAVKNKFTMKTKYFSK